MRSLSEPPALIESRASEADMPPTLTAPGEAAAGAAGVSAGFSGAMAAGVVSVEGCFTVGAGSPSVGAGGEACFASSSTTSFGGARSATLVVDAAAAAGSVGALAVGSEAATATGDIASGSELTGIEPGRLGTVVGGMAMGAGSLASAAAADVAASSSRTTNSCGPGRGGEVRGSSAPGPVDLHRSRSITRRYRSCRPNGLRMGP